HPSISSSISVLFFLTARRPPPSTLFPYTTLFRSRLRPRSLRSFGQKDTPLRARGGGVEPLHRFHQHEPALCRPDQFANALERVRRASGPAPWRHVERARRDDRLEH